MPMNKKYKKALLALSLSVLFLLVAGATSVYLIFGDMLFSKSAEENDNKTVNEAPKELYFNKPVNILVLGIDQRGNEKSRTDTIMVYRLDAAKKEVKLFSIPRDTYVNIPGRGMDKINHAHAFGDIELAQQTVEEFLGVKVDYYVRTNFEGFKGLIDLIGGVTIDVEKDIKGTDIKPGLQKLDSAQALAYVRDRKDPMGDIARVKRQQKFIKALIDGVGGFDQKWKLVAVAPKLYSNVKTNIPLKASEELVTALKGINSENAEIEVVPGWFYNKNGISYWKPDEEKTAEIVAKLFKEEVAVSTEENKTTTN